MVTAEQSYRVTRVLISIEKYTSVRAYVVATKTTFCLVDGKWGAWGGWSTCTKTCKQGKQSRTRECNSPVPQHGGKKCDGEGKETQICNEMVPCPGKM